MSSPHGAAVRRTHIVLMPAVQGRKTCPRKTCPICGKPAVDRLRPFCSRRCADVDLNRWLSGVYAVPVTEDEEEDERRDEAGETP